MILAFALFGAIAAQNANASSETPRLTCGAKGGECSGTASIPKGGIEYVPTGWCTASSAGTKPNKMTCKSHSVWITCEAYSEFNGNTGDYWYCQCNYDQQKEKYDVKWTIWCPK